MKPEPLFSDAERQFLNRLVMEPLWQSILKKLEPAQVPTFRPDLVAIHSEKQYELWVYESGFAAGANNILEVLKPE